MSRSWQGAPSKSTRMLYARASLFPLYRQKASHFLPRNYWCISQIVPTCSVFAHWPRQVNHPNGYTPFPLTSMPLMHVRVRAGPIIRYYVVYKIRSCTVDNVASERNISPVKLSRAKRFCALFFPRLKLYACGLTSTMLSIINGNSHILCQRFA